MGLRIVFIGAGNLATRLSLELRKRGYVIEQVYSRTSSSATLLSNKLDCQSTTSPRKIVLDADIYFVALKDSAYEEVLPHVAFGNKLVVHCSGSMPLSVLSIYSENTGVLYPLQTFSKQRPVRFKQIPVLIEANTEANEKRLLQIAGTISENVMVLNSESRLQLHIAAVFACNFTNHLYVIASEILKKENLPFKLLTPLIMETAKKVRNSVPELAQTGPAVRYDKNIISAHIKELEKHPDYRKIYESLSQSIYNYHLRK